MDQLTNMKPEDAETTRLGSEGMYNPLLAPSQIMKKGMVSVYQGVRNSLIHENKKKNNMSETKSKKSTSVNKLGMMIQASRGGMANMMMFQNRLKKSNAGFDIMSQRSENADLAERGSINSDCNLSVGRDEPANSSNNFIAEPNNIKRSGTIADRSRRTNKSRSATKQAYEDEEFTKDV